LNFKINPLHLNFSESVPDPIPPENEPLEMPITSELDLHTFRPQDLGDLLPDYLQACRAKGILEVRVIHGKGIGNLKRSVEAILPRLDFVERFAPASTLFGGAGATIVWLRAPARSPE
jgi:DNA-nicking Smr family endonuclease